MATTADVVIIGAGVIGTALAYELGKMGRRTVSVDRHRQPGHGSTSASCAIIRMHYSTLDGTAFAYEGYFYWRDWKDYLQAADARSLATFRETGCLVMKTQLNGYLERHMAHSRTLDCPFEQWGAERIQRQLRGYDLRRFAPAKRTADNDFGRPSGGDLSGGVFWPTAGYVTDPALSSSNLADAARRVGGEFMLGETVTEVLQSGGRVSGVRLASGQTVHAPVVVNVAGPASSAINAMAGVLDDMRIKTRALRQEVAHVPAPQEMDFDRHGIVVSDSDIACYIRPEHGGNILIGSEDPPCDAHIWVDDVEGFDRQFTDQWTTQVMRYAQRLPSLGIPSQSKGVVDLYDASDDWIPIYDQSSLPGFYMACGTSGNQFKNAPIAGKLMAELIEYCEAGNDHDTKPLSMRLPYLNRDINVGFYSRRRQINEDSSFSVLG